MLFASLIFRIPHSQFRIQIEFPLKASFWGQKGGLTYISLYEKILLELLENILTSQSGAFE